MDVRRKFFKAHPEMEVSRERKAGTERPDHQAYQASTANQVI